MTACRPNCGACCDPVVLPYAQDDEIIEMLDERTQRWVRDELTPMNRHAAKRKAPWLFGVRVTHSPAGGDTTPHTYRCVHFDPASRECDDYENRPRPCRGFPWAGGPPIPNAALPPECEFRADIGQPVVLRRRR